MSWLDKLRKWVEEDTTQSGNVVAGDMAGGDIVRQVIKGSGNVQVGGSTSITTGNGMSIVNRNGHIVINGKVRSLTVNGEEVLL